ncbi:MAG TPA: type II toxin-antitoxin system RelE/ParE family toxin [Bryobacteraceae bacterium]|nr:type II toxin-antitoxin system RelE/ParE family toxin [Bryobacteraceae bacterium]
MNLRWTPTAALDLEQVHEYIARDSPEAAGRTVDAILKGIDALLQNPLMGRVGRLGRTRELVFSPFVGSYRVKSGSLEILSIIHGARRWD